LGTEELNHAPIDYDPFQDLYGDKAFSHGCSSHVSFQRLTVRELAMLQFIDAITDKPDWQRKLCMPEVVQKWKAEALDQSDGLIDEAVFGCLMSELRQKSEEFDEKGYVKALDTESRVVKSDTVVDSTLQEELKSAVAKLAKNVPEDWHPHTNQQVLNLVHPSLYPLVYGRTRVLTSRRTNLDQSLLSEGHTNVPLANQLVANHWRGEYYYDSRFNNKGLVSTQFQWLPCEVEFADEVGTDVKITSYVNNLHPHQNQHLYRILEKMIAKSIPLWNTVLFRGCHGRTPPRITTNEAEFDLPCPEDKDWPSEWPEAGSQQHFETMKRVEKYFEQPDNPMWTPPYEDDPGSHIPENWKTFIHHEPRYCSLDPFSLVYKKWHRIRRLKQPLPKDTLCADLEDVRLEKEFRDRGLQVIVQLSSIELSPESPVYPGGSWHLEGMQNEHIAATAIYYYDVHNTKTARISFRQDATLEDYDLKYEQDDHEPLAKLFGIETCCGQVTGSPPVQIIGSIQTLDRRLVAFPNTLQHQINPFELQDKSQPGHRRFLVLWLVDPHFRVLSTANVPPQQKDWWDEAGISPVGPMQGVPVQNMMTLEEAKEYRLELMKERTVFHDTMEGNQETMASMPLPIHVTSPINRICRQSVRDGLCNALMVESRCLKTSCKYT
jgi:hypothetical protein